MSFLYTGCALPGVRVRGAVCNRGAPPSMHVTFNLAALLNVLLAVSGLLMTLPEVRGRPVKLWRLGLPPFFCTMTAIIMLANTPAPHVLEFARLVAGLIGAVTGVVAGNFVKVKTDQMWGLVEFRPAFMGAACAFGIVLLVFADSTAVLMGHGIWPLAYDPAVAAALLSGFLDGRAWRIAAKAVRSPHTDLNDR
jgi:uncharacterized membrane protein YeaQ/YmgE (transglycosylase-associated protein family)